MIKFQPLIQLQKSLIEVLHYLMAAQLAFIFTCLFSISFSFTLDYSLLAIIISEHLHRIGCVESQAVWETWMRNMKKIVASQRLYIRDCSNVEFQCCPVACHIFPCHWVESFAFWNRDTQDFCLSHIFQGGTNLGPIRIVGMYRTELRRCTWGSCFVQVFRYQFSYRTDWLWQTFLAESLFIK